MLYVCFFASSLAWQKFNYEAVGSRPGLVGASAVQTARMTFQRNHYERSCQKIYLFYYLYFWKAKVMRYDVFIYAEIHISFAFQVRRYRCFWSGRPFGIEKCAQSDQMPSPIVKTRCLRQRQPSQCLLDWKIEWLKNWKIEKVISKFVVDSYPTLHNLWMGKKVSFVKLSLKEFYTISI